jgi:hypothetical protein
VSDTAPDPLEQAWQQVWENWEDADAHRNFIAFSFTIGKLAEAGRRYHQVRDEDPARRAEADGQIRKLLTQAVSALEVSRTDPQHMERSKRWIRLSGLIAATLLIAAALIAMLQGG